jgi:hypothetical protein
MSMMNAADSQTTSVGMIEIMVTHALVHGMKHHPVCISAVRGRYGSCRRAASGTKIHYLPLFIFGRWPALWAPACGALVAPDATRPRARHGVALRVRLNPNAFSYLG